MNDPQQAQEIISQYFSEPVKVTAGTHRGKPALIITSAAEYDVPEYTGTGGLVGLFTMMQDACGGNQLDTLRDIRQGGCDTCDYGSLYGTEYVVWTA